MDYEVVDDFLPKFYFDSIRNVVLSDNFPWYAVLSSSGEKQIIKANGVHFPENQTGFFHLSYTHLSGPLSFAYQTFEPIINLIPEKFNTNVASLSRIRLGMTTNIGVNGSHYPHVDFIDPHKTLLYYFNDSDGDTIFYDKKYGEDISNGLNVKYRHTPKANQAVLFDGLIYHSSSFPTRNLYRVTMNINFQEEGMLNKNG